VSTPRTLQLPEGVQPTTISTGRGDFAALSAVPAVGTPLGTVLLVPGWTGSKEDFTPLVAELAGYGWRAYAIDQRGQYQTPGPDDPAAYELDELGLDLVAVSKELGGFSQLVGHSLGGLVGQAAVLADASVFSTLSLVCSGPSGFTDQNVRSQLELLAYGLENLPIEQVYDLKLEHDRKQPDWVEPPVDVAAFMRTKFTSNSPVGLASLTRRLVDAPDRVDQVAKSGVRAQVLSGATDDAWPLDAQQDLAERLGTRVQVIPDAGHSPAIEQPGTTARLLTDFFHDRSGVS
jgi:pimeloyl-ACP methyl ester carboxylesterase